MTRDEAVKIVARRVVADLVDLHIGDEWENYPDVLEEAWYEVQASAGAEAFR